MEEQPLAVKGNFQSTKNSKAISRKWNIEENQYSSMNRQAISKVLDKFNKRKVNASGKKKVLSESVVQRQCVELLRRTGWLVVRVNGGGFSNDSRYIATYHIFGVKKPSAGFPDLIAFKNGRTLLLELKKKSGKVSPAQNDFHKFAELFGVTVHTIKSVEDMLNLIEAERK